MRNICKELDLHFRNLLFDVDVILHFNHKESQTQTEIKGYNTQDYINHNSPPT